MACIPVSGLMSASGGQAAGTEWPGRGVRTARVVMLSNKWACAFLSLVVGGRFQQEQKQQGAVASGVGGQATRKQQQGTAGQGRMCAALPIIGVLRKLVDPPTCDLNLGVRLLLDLLDRGAPAGAGKRIFSCVPAAQRLPPVPPGANGGNRAAPSHDRPSTSP